MANETVQNGATISGLLHVFFFWVRQGVKQAGRTEGWNSSDTEPRVVIVRILPIDYISLGRDKEEKWKQRDTEWFRGMIVG